MKLGLPLSISMLFWSLAGLIRYIFEKKFSPKKRVSRKLIAKKEKFVAVCIPAHNEEAVIDRTLRSVKKLVAKNQIYVVSDGSSDDTAKIVRRHRCRVLELNPGAGKAKALRKLVEHFHLLKRCEFVLFVDADTLINSQYVKRALRIFILQPEVAAISGYAITVWRKHKRPTVKKFIEAYRVRLSFLIQLFLVYGRTWKYTNAETVLPGSASIYRTRVLKHLELDTPGIMIEDFNLAFQIHKKGLGKIGHHPSIYSFDSEPHTIRDYWNQVRRWNIGYYQTLRIQGFWPSLFWLSTGFYTIEVLINAVLKATLPLTILIVLLSVSEPFFSPQVRALTNTITRAAMPIADLLIIIFVIVFLYDYLYTLITAAVRKNWQLAFYGLGFIFFQYLDALIALIYLPAGFLTKSDGRWKSPQR